MNELFHLVGLVILLIGLVSLFLSWKINHEQEMKMAILEKAASDARTEQQKVQIELAKQQERAAKAEKELLALQERMKGGFLKLEGQ